MSGLLNDDRYLRCFWPICPDEVKDVMEVQVIPAAHRNPHPRATDAILREASKCSWYQRAPLASRYQFHSLVGHVVRVARDYDVDQTQDGKPKMMRSKRGPHRKFTLQVRRNQPVESKINTNAYRQFPGGPLTPSGVAEIERRFDAGQPNSEIALAMVISLGGVSKRRGLWRREKAKTNDGMIHIGECEQ